MEDGYYDPKTSKFYCKRCAAKLHKINPFNMDEYYDPEYNKYVDKDYIERQNKYFSNQSWFHDTYEEFLVDNFCLDSDMASIKEY